MFENRNFRGSEDGIDIGEVDVNAGMDDTTDDATEEKDAFECVAGFTVTSKTTMKRTEQ